MSQPYYTLRQLIYNKYGKEKFALGTKLVAGWLNANCSVRYTKENIAAFCAIESPKNLSFIEEEREALRQLFGLQSTEELYTHTSNSQ